MPKKKTAAQKKTMTKAAFVRSQARDMSAKEVIAKAKAAGIPLTEDTIYKTRVAGQEEGQEDWYEGACYQRLDKRQRRQEAAGPRAEGREP